jgi:hypothetical protein
VATSRRQIAVNDDVAKQIQEIITQPVPDQLKGKIELKPWAMSLFTGVEYKEPDPEYLSRLLMLDTLLASTPDEVFERAGIGKLQEVIPDTPGAGTGAVAIEDLYVAASDFEEGAPCYVILTCRSIDTGEYRKYTTGSSGLQAQLLRLVSFGMWPIRCNIKRINTKDKGGHYLFWIAPPVE